MRRRPIVPSALATLVFVGLGASVAGAQAASAPVLRPRTLAEDLQMFGQVLNQVRVNHVDSLDMHRLMQSAVQGLLRAADPHSYVVTAERYSEQTAAQADAGKLVPVPVSFRYVAGVPVVASIAAGAREAVGDIRPGDVLVAIDSAAVRADGELELETMLAGPKGSVVKLGLERERTDGTRVTLVRPVKRQEAKPETAVPAAFLLDSTTAYVRITTFVGERIAADLERGLSRLERAGMQRLVLDLRDNGGGRVDEAALVAGAFLPEGTVVYTAEGRRSDVADTGRVRRAFWKSARRVPMAVLINEGSASASELVAGALQDHDRARIVGRPSFGKALLMRGFPLVDGSVIVLVVGQLRTPCGRVVQRSYQGVRAAQYYRSAGTVRDTVGRPSCRTAGGRVVYGGGGIYPDVVLPPAARAPDWLSALDEQDLITQWAAAYVGERGSPAPSADALAASPLPGDVLIRSLRGYASAKGVTLPADAETSAALARRLNIELAWQKWGDAGAFRVAAPGDREVQEAVAALRGAP